MMKSVKIPILLIFSLLLISVATAAIVKPITGASVAGTTVILNATNASLPNMVNCTWTIGSASTANTTSTFVFTNKSADPLIINGSFNSLTFEDSNDYTVTAVCRNTTSVSTTSTSTGVIIDNTIPQAPSSLTPATDTKDTDGSVAFSATVTGRNTTSCTMYFSGTNPGATSYAMTHSGNTCSKTLTLPEQIYDWYIIASDGTNTTTSSTARVQTDISGNTVINAAILNNELKINEGGKTLSTVGGGLSDLSSGQILVGLIIVLLLVFILNKRR